MTTYFGRDHHQQVMVHPSEEFVLTYGGTDTSLNIFEVKFYITITNGPKDDYRHKYKRSYSRRHLCCLLIYSCCLLIINCRCRLGVQEHPTYKGSEPRTHYLTRRHCIYQRTTVENDQEISPQWQYSAEKKWCWK